MVEHSSTSIINKLSDAKLDETHVHQNQPVRKSEVKVIGNLKVFLDKKLGEGATGKVYEGELRQKDVGGGAAHQKDIKVAVKVVDQAKIVERGPKQQEYLDNELRILQQLVHPNIVKFYELKRTAKSFYFVFEACMGGDLKSLLAQRRRLPELEVQVIFKQLGNALKCMHMQNVAHRDIKPANVLLSADGKIKLADFGLAKVIQEDLMKTVVGTPYYIAPEIFQKQMYTGKADLWSVGIILFQLLAGEPPFTGMNQEQLYQNVLNGSYSMPGDVKISPICQDLLIKLIVMDPEKRMTYTDFFKHPFVLFDKEPYDQAYQQSIKGQQRQSMSTCNESNQNAASSQHQPQAHGNSSTSQEPDYTIEDLQETLIDVAEAVKLTLTRAQAIYQMAQNELDIDQIGIKTHTHDKEIKYLIFNIAKEIALVIKTFCCKDFLEAEADEQISKQNQSSEQSDSLLHKALPEIEKLKQTEILNFLQGSNMNDQNQSQQNDIKDSTNMLVSEANDKSDPRDSLQVSQQPQDKDTILWLQSNREKKIRLNSFLLKKLNQDPNVGNQLSQNIIKLASLFNKLTNFITSFSYMINQYDKNTLTEGLRLLALNMAQDAAQSQQLGDYKQSTNKYITAKTVLNELITELILFKNLMLEDCGHSSEDQFLQQQQCSISDDYSNHLNTKVKSFTFDCENRQTLRFDIINPQNQQNNDSEDQIKLQATIESQLIQEEQTLCDMMESINKQLEISQKQLFESCNQ